MPTPQDTIRTTGSKHILLLLPTLLLALLALPVSFAHATGDQNEAFCPQVSEASPGFRTFLPDCRAYELVTPPYIAGQQVRGTDKAPPLMTANGERVLGVDFAAFASDENLEQATDFGSPYEFTRTAGGWAAEALVPPASEFPRSEFVFVSADLTKSLWLVDVPGYQGEEFPKEVKFDGWQLAVREAAGGGRGHFRLVGPVAAPGHGAPTGAIGEEPYRVLGAAGDLSHIVLSEVSGHGQLWPGDTTREGDKSLYEYRGGPEPVLVGVRNNGLLDGVGHVNKGAQLVSVCGTRLGSSKVVSGSNAISGSGGVTFFTALACEGEPEVDELYARVAGEKTVALSEPPLSGPESIPGRECTGTCQTDETVPVDRSPAVYQGASLAGDKVFFTSTQPLVNAAMGGGDYLYVESLADEGAGSHVTSLQLAGSEVENVAAVSQDGTRVYFHSQAVLAGAGANANGEEPQLGSSNLYVYDTETGRLAFVTQEAGTVEVPDSGRFAVFYAGKDLQGTGDTSTVSQLFEYDASTDAVARVSTGQHLQGTLYECPVTKTLEAGYDCNGNTENGEEAPLMAERGHTVYTSSQFAEPAAATSGLSVAEDGTVVFASPLALTSQALRGRVIETNEFGQAVVRTENIYEYRSGNVYLISPADEAAPLHYVIPNEESRLLGIDQSGEDVFFLTGDNLVPQDVDSQQSWYDARVEGGFPAPAGAPSCSGETCQGALPSVPAFVAPGSNTLTVPNNLAQSAEPKPAVKPKAKPKAKACKKGDVKRKGKCVKASQSKRASKSTRRSK